MIARAHVPCNGCTACCHADVIQLYPQHGDDVESYEHVVVPIPDSRMNHAYAAILKKGEDGNCIYLREGRCSIWERAPFICRIFDCRRWFLSKTRPERRRMVKAGMASREVFDAGRRRVDTL
jgi:Fe-S-cluster containining protein